MKKIPLFIFAIISLSIISCLILKKNEPQKAKPVYLKYSIKVYTDDPKRENITNYIDSAFLVFRQDSLIIKLPKSIYLSKFDPSDSTVFLADVTTPSSIEYEYVCINLKDSTATLYPKGIRDKRGIKINADSLFNTRIATFPTLIDPKIDSLIKLEEGKTTRTEFYFARSKPDFSYFDSTMISFNSKWPSFPFSLSKELEASRKMKLSFFRMKANAYKDKTTNQIVPEREIQVELRLLNPFEDAFIDSLFK